MWECGGRGPHGKGEMGRRDGGLTGGHLYDMCGERLVMLGELVMRHSKEIAWLANSYEVLLPAGKMREMLRLRTRPACCCFIQRTPC